MKRSILHNDLAGGQDIADSAQRHLYVVSTISTVVSSPPHQHCGAHCPPHQQSSSSCRHFAPPASSTTRFVSEQRQKRPFVSLCSRPPSFAHNQDSKAGHFHGCHTDRGSNFHQLFPRNARSRVKVRALNHLVNSQRPAVEVQQFNGRC